MAKQKPAAPQSSFAASLLALSYRFPLSQVFDDFLTMSIAACTQNPLTGKSSYEDEYLATIAKYKDSDLRFEFPNAFASLITEMDKRVQSLNGNDALGEFFEEHISNGRNGQYFTPFPLCTMLASLTHLPQKERAQEAGTPLRILDPSCGSGRMLLASRNYVGTGHEFYGIDIDRMCVKMAALNLFFNGVWHSEVMCANALSPTDFVISYRISLLPLGIFKVAAEQSKLWHMQKDSFERGPSRGDAIILDSTPFDQRPKDTGTQLDLFEL